MPDNSKGKEYVLSNKPVDDKESRERNEKLNEGIAAYIGMSAPETPKYLLTNNFLLEYFTVNNNTSEQYNYEWFENRKVLSSEDASNNDNLENSFNVFLNCYLGEDTIKRENRHLSETKHFYFPFTPEMLTGSNPTLRHILFHLQNLDNKFDYEDVQRKLDNYIFHDMSGLNHILKILLSNQEENTKYRNSPSKEITKNFWIMLSQSELKRMRKLGENLNKDLNTLLTHEYFCKLDFYRKYNYLSILLASYIIQYIVFRRDANMGMLCKGAPADNRLNGAIHRACCNNYAAIRSLFPNLLQQYYEEVVKRVADNDGHLHGFANGKDVYIGDKLFADFATDTLGSRSKMQDLQYDTLVNAFALNKEEDTPISVSDFVVRYINLTGSRRGSVLSKISSTLPTSGKQIEMIFPKSNAKNKYFAMSANLTEFYVRLYLAEKRQSYDYLDNFIQHLQDKYRIILIKPNDSGKLLKHTKPALSAQEFSKNKLAFIDTLNGINCLVKLSDSGYVITLPEMKGDLKLV